MKFYDLDFGPDVPRNLSVGVIERQPFLSWRKQEQVVGYPLTRLDAADLIKRARRKGSARKAALPQ